MTKEQAIRIVLHAFDEGVFVRSTNGDHDPAWAIKLTPAIQALSVLHHSVGASSGEASALPQQDVIAAAVAWASNKSSAITVDGIKAMHARILELEQALAEASALSFSSGENSSGGTTICPACVVSDPRIRLCDVHKGGESALPLQPSRAVENARRWLDRQRVADGREPMLDEGDCRFCGMAAGEGHEPTDPCGIVANLLEELAEASARPPSPIVVDRDADLRREMRAYLDTLTITGDTIGDIRRSLFVPWDSAWNGWVRDDTAEREKPAGESARPPQAPERLRAAFTAGFQWAINGTDKYGDYLGGPVEDGFDSWLTASAPPDASAPTRTDRSDG